MNAERLLKHYARIADAPDAIARLRRFILDLAVRGKLVSQNGADEQVKSNLLERVLNKKQPTGRTGADLGPVTLQEVPLGNGHACSSSVKSMRQSFTAFCSQ